MRKTRSKRKQIKKPKRSGVVGSMTINARRSRKGREVLRLLQEVSHSPDKPAE